MCNSSPEAFLFKRTFLIPATSRIPVINYSLKKTGLFFLLMIGRITLPQNGTENLL
jgi:hypothetical protein